MNFKKIFLGFFLFAANFACATETVHQDVFSQRRCGNCLQVENSVFIVIRSFQRNPDLQFYHLQSQLGSALRLHQTTRPCPYQITLINRIKRKLDQLRPQVSEETMQELINIDELHYDPVQDR